MTAFPIRSTLAGAVFVASVALRQTMPVTTLSTPLAEFPEGYTSLEGLRELPDGPAIPDVRSSSSSRQESGK
jgi:hypothetical protein